MPKYKTTYNNSIYAFTEIESHNNICLFKGVSPSGQEQYEIHILRYKMAHPRSANAGTKILSSPSSSEWGVYGFTYQSKDRAMEKFRKLAEKSDMNADKNADSSGSVAA
jgi:hypothetical protein